MDRSMNGELPFREIDFPFASRQKGLFRLALVASTVIHAAGLLVSPYLQPAPPAVQDVVSVDLADIPRDRLPAVPPMPRKASPPRPVPELPASPPTREAVREKVARKGVLGVLARAAASPEGDADPLSRIRLPADIPVASKSAPREADFRPKGHEVGEPSAAAAAPGIGRHVTASARSATTLSSRVFRTDAGLDAEIRGGTDDRSRSPGAIASTVRRYRSGIQYAYNKELLANPALSGEIVVAFRILPDGSVASAEILRSSVGWPALDDAVLRRLRYWKFPRSDGETVRVTFPFVFHPEM